MRAFITGASGFIGSRLVEHLLGRGWSVRALVHDTPLSPACGVETVRGDIRDPGPWRDAMKGTDVLFHLAAALGFARITEAGFMDVNARGTEALFRAAADAGVRKAVYVSSAGVIGAVCPGDVASEDYPPNPMTPYDRTKLEAERIALRLAGDPMAIIVARPGWAYGPGDRRTFKVIKAIHDRRFALVAGGTGRQTPVFIDDLVRGLELASEKGKSGEIFHLAGNEILTVREMAAEIAEACGTRPPRLSIPRLPAAVAAWTLEKAFAPFKTEAPLSRSRLAFFLHPKALSNAKARRELGFAPKTDFREGMAKTVAWYRQNGWL
jgi:nucleoside-diphosphate-sugar epimerase